MTYSDLGKRYGPNCRAAHRPPARRRTSFCEKPHSVAPAITVDSKKVPPRACRPPPATTRAPRSATWLSTFSIVALASARVNPAVPITVSEQVESTHAAFEAGAAIVHAHVRNDGESPSSDPERFARLKEGIEPIARA